MKTSDLLTSRIRRIRRELCDDDNGEFARRIGKSHQHASALCNGKSRAGVQTLETLLSAFPTLRPEWLYFGDGAMLTEEPVKDCDTATLYADISDTFTHLAQLFGRLAVCVK